MSWEKPEKKRTLLFSGEDQREENKTKKDRPQEGTEQSPT